MGAVCSLDDHDHQEDEETAHSLASSPGQQGPLSQSSPVAAGPGRADDPPRDVQLHRVWTSVVVGELIKQKDGTSSSLSLYDESVSVVQVVQGMIKSGANYALVRKAGPGDSPTAPPPSVTARRRKHREQYLGLFDWRDLNALLVAVCKSNRLHGATTGPQGQGKAPPSIATAAQQNALRLQQEAQQAQLDAEADEPRVEELSSGGAQDNEVVPLDPSDAAAAPSPPSPQHAATLARPLGRPLLMNGASTASPSSASRSTVTGRGAALQPGVPGSLQSSSHALNLPGGISEPNSGRSSQNGTTTGRPAGSLQPAAPALTSANGRGPSSSSYVPLSPSSHLSAASPFVSPFAKQPSPTSSLSPAFSEPSALSPYLHFLDMKRAPISLVANLSGRNPMQVVNSACPLLGGAQLLVGLIGANGDDKKKTATTGVRLWKGKNAGGTGSTSSGKELAPPTRPELYRLTVVNKDGMFLGCMTQLQLAAWVKLKLDALGSMADDSLYNLGLGRSQRVMTVSWRSPVLTALLLMHDRRLSALAIINDVNGKLVGTISCSDVKYLFLAPDLLLTLQRPVSVFVHMLRQSTSFWHVNIAASNCPATATSSSVTVTPKSTLRAAVDKLLSTKVRRAWIVNEAEQPIGMVSIADVVKLALPHQKDPQGQAGAGAAAAVH